MKTFTFYRFLSRVTAVALFFGFLTSVQAQLTVENNTGCDLIVFAKQADNTTFAACDGCPPATGQTFVISGGTATIGVNPGCGIEFWQNFFWRTNSSFSPMGQSANPLLGGNCGSEILGPCFGTTAAWLLTNANGSGPVTVTIN